MENGNKEQGTIVINGVEVYKDAWVGFDLDGVLARYDKWKGFSHIGEPILPMKYLLLDYIKQGIKVKIFTARCSGGMRAVAYIKQWLKDNEFPELEVTNVKDLGMICLYDDRCYQVKCNMGIIVGQEENKS